MAHMLLNRCFTSALNASKQANVCGKLQTPFQDLQCSLLKTCGECRPTTQIKTWSSTNEESVPVPDTTDGDTFGVLDKQFQEKASTKSLFGQDLPKKTSSKHSKNRTTKEFSKKHAEEKVYSGHSESKKIYDGQRHTSITSVVNNDGDERDDIDSEPGIRKVVLKKGALPVRTRRNLAGQSEVFGFLAKKYPKYRDSEGYLASGDTGVEKMDEQDKLETYYTPLSMKPTVQEYSNKMFSLVKENKLKEALELFENKMIKEDRLRPNKSVLNVLINGCGKVGYVEMGFKLYQQMRDRGMKPSDSTYTGLFNACANSPWPEIGLQKSHKLLQKMRNANVAFTTIHYHVMMKAFGRCGDLKTVFALADEMAEKKILMNAETLSFILMGCAQDKENGFLYAVEAWRKFRLQKIPLNVFNYNLLLRVSRDCEAGKPELANQLLTPDPASQRLPATPALFPGDEEESFELEEDTKRIGSEDAKLASGHVLPPPGSERGTDVVQILTAEEKTKLLRNEGAIPDLLSPAVNAGKVVALAALDTATSRLQALGGPLGFISRMKKSFANPNMKTFTLMLDMLPPSCEFEEELIAMIDQCKLDPDIDFFNILIKRRCKRNNFDEAKDVLRMIQERALLPDVVTYGSLALGCNIQSQANELLSHLTNLDYHPNVEIMASLISRGLFRKDWSYVMNMLKVMQKEEIKPNILLLRLIENNIDRTKKILVKEERGLEVFPRFKEESFKISFRNFMFYYKDWLKSTGVDHCDPMEAYRPDKNVEPKEVKLADSQTHLRDVLSTKDVVRDDWEKF